LTDCAFYDAMRAVVLLPIVAAVQVMDTHNVVDVQADGNYEGMKSTLKSISAMQVKGEIDQDTINTVTKTLKDINEKLIDALEQDKKHSQSILDAAEAAIDSCDTAKNTWVSGQHATDTGAANDANGDHNQCRENTGGEQELCANATTHCDALTQQVCNWNDCVAPTAGFGGGDTDEVNTFMKCIGSFFGQHKVNYYQKRQNCIDATNSWNTKSTACDGLQQDFEDDFCTQEANTQSACETYRLCRNREQSSYMQIKGEIEALEDIYQAQRVALECLLCYGNKILANSTDLSDCERETTCTSLTACPVIVYDNIAECIPCSEPDDVKPCESSFLTTYYGRYENTCSPPQQCKACTGSAATNSEGGATCEACPTCPREAPP